MYPVEGALYHAYPGDWQVWKALDNESGYDRIATFEEKPDTSEITAAFARDRAERDQRRLEEYAREHGNGIPLSMLLSSAALSIAGTAWYMLHF